MSNDIHDSPSQTEYVLKQEIHIKSLLSEVTMVLIKNVLLYDLTLELSE